MTTSNRQQRVGEVFDKVIELATDAREAFLGDACAGDDELRASVQALLDGHERASEFLDPPLPAAAMTLLSDFTDDALVGCKVGPYKLIEVIASGGMGTVFRAKHVDGEKSEIVAVKLIRPGMDSHDIIRRFIVERETLAKLVHPSIARMLDGGISDDGRPYLVMEYVEGMPITDYCDEQKLSIRDRLQIVRKVCAAVQYAHQNLVVHRDIKPSNILVTSDGIPKLLDFGIAKLTSESATETTFRTITSTRYVTPQYASPEVIRGEPASTSMDVYSMGLVLYELLTGHRAYDLRNRPRDRVVQIICEEDPPPPSTVIYVETQIIDADGVTRTIREKTVSEKRKCSPQDLHHLLHGDLDNVVHTSLHKDVIRRYSSIEQLDQDIQRYLTGFPVRARRDTFGYRARKFYKRHIFGTVVAALILLLLLTTVAGTTYGLAKANKEASRALREARKATQINAVLQQMLSSANPNAGNRDMKVREVLDHSANRLLPELADQPEVAAAVHATIGESYMALGMHEEAQPHLQTALNLRKGVFGETHEEVANSLAQLGNAYRISGDFDEAEELLNEAAAVNRALFGDNNKALARNLASLGVLMHERSRYGEAESLLRDALAMGRLVFSDHPSDLSYALEKLALTLSQRGKFSEAEAYCRESLVLTETLFGVHHPRVSESTRRLAIVLHQGRKFALAEPLYRKALAMDREFLGDKHRNVARILHNLGTLQSALGRRDEAIPLVREALDIRREVFGNEHALVASTLNTLATLHDADRAEPFLVEALVIARKAHGSDHIFVAAVLQNLAAIYRGRDQCSKARPFYVEALAIYEKTLGREHMKTSYPLEGLAHCMMNEDQATKALPLFQRALQIRERILSKESNHPLLAEAKGAMGTCLVKLERFVNAEPLLLKSYQIMKKGYGPKHPDTVLALEAIIELYESWKKPAEVQEYRVLLVESSK